MKRFGIVLIVVMFGLVLACGSQEEKAPAKKAPPPATAQKGELQAPAPSTGEREQYEKKISQQIDDLQQRVANLKTQVEKAAGDVKVQMEKEIAALEQKLVAAKKDLADLASATGKAWNDLKAKMDAAMGDLEKDYERAKSGAK